MQSKNKLQIQQSIWGTDYYINETWKERQANQVKKDKNAKLKLKLIGEKHELTIIVNDIIR